MQEPSKLQISDLEILESVVEQEGAPDESTKIVGGICPFTPTFPENPIPLPPFP